MISRLNCFASILSIVSGGNQAHHLLITMPMVAATSCGGRDRADCVGRVEGSLNEAKYRETLDENLVQRALGLRLVFVFPHDSDPQQTAKTTQGRLGDNSVNVLE